MGSAPASLADNPFLITLLLEMQTTIFLRTEMSRKTEYVHNPCFLSANILKILGVFAENQIYIIIVFMLKNLPLSSEYKRKMKIFNEGRAYYHNKQIKEMFSLFLQHFIC